ncbi:MAG TPA: hypothetical protein VGQ76_22865 [Thermoanaerobaculia bacterium]|jgi:hypothetical protein|nr:hypothetical protein [Thermoanaerobaculia bacterium]
MQNDPRAIEAKAESFSRYAWRWLKLTFAGTKGFIGDVGLVFGLFVAWSHARWQTKMESLLASWVPATAGYEDSVAFVPLYIAGGYLILRALLAPFWMAQKARKEQDETRLRFESELSAERKSSRETTESLQRRISQLEAPAPRVLVRATDDSEAPLAVKNVGPVEAHNVKICDLTYGTDAYVEFEVIDPLECTCRDEVPEFRVLHRNGDNTDVFSMMNFFSFTDPMPEQSFNDLARRAGIPGDEKTWTGDDFAKMYDMGPLRYPLRVEYLDPTGKRRFETLYEWERPWSSRNIVVHFVGYREIT